VLSLGGIFMAKLENKFAKCNIITLFWTTSETGEKMRVVW
jgi:hypothetical protein